MEQPFNYSEAFCRNIGLLTEEEQEQLRQFTIAIPGMGGVGGAHLISLVRQGFEKFKIADPDQFELANTNRQYGARIDTFGTGKVVVMKEEVLKINPQCTIEAYEYGINSENMHAFLSGVDLVIDSLDSFAADARRELFMTAYKARIPVITAGPLGFGTAFLIFMPDGPSYDSYFAITDKLSYEKKLIAFFLGLAPKLLQRSYMQRVSLEERRGPSSIVGVNLCAGIATMYALKILLKKGKIKAVPYYHQFDAMKDRYVVRKLWFGNYHPLQQLKMMIAKRLVKD